MDHKIKLLLLPTLFLLIIGPLSPQAVERTGGITLLPSGAFTEQIAFDSVQTPAIDCLGSGTVTWSHGIAETTHTLLIVALGGGNYGSAVVTFEGVAMAYRGTIQDLGGNIFLSVWTLADPPAGSGTVQSDTTPITALSISYRHVLSIVGNTTARTGAAAATFTTGPFSVGALQAAVQVVIAGQVGGLGNPSVSASSSQNVRGTDVTQSGSCDSAALIGSDHDTAVGATTRYFNWTATNTANWAERTFVLAPSDGWTCEPDCEPPPTTTPYEIFPPLSFSLAGIRCSPGLIDSRCWTFLTTNATRVLIVQSRWYVDGSYVGLGVAADPRQHWLDLSPGAFPSRTANLTVDLYLDNGQRIRVWDGLYVDRSWVLAVVILGILAVPMIGLWRLSHYRRY